MLTQTAQYVFQIQIEILFDGLTKGSTDMVKRELSLKNLIVKSTKDPYPVKFLRSVYGDHRVGLSFR